ncbi:MAG: DUF305 domain-containing protein, partial [Gaiellaceae bacterium]
MNKLVVLVTIVVVSIAMAGCGGSDGEEPTAASQVPFDRAFIDAMVPHHREAIEMAKSAETRGLTALDLNEIASDIVASQQREIDDMLGWRQQWYGSRAVGPIQPEVLGVPENELGMKHGSADEVAGAIDVDATFAALMTAHHKGAIAMAEAARHRAEREEIQNLAAEIIDAQEREIGIMEEHASE